MNKEIDWKKVRRVLLIRLRSIGDTVLATPSLIALKRFVPDAQIDILLEDWVAPVLDGLDAVDNVLTVGKSGKSRFRTSGQVRKNKYDVVVNLHGGTTGTFFTFASGAAHRVGYANYQYGFLYNHLLSSSADFWGRAATHSAEQQLALLGSVGVPVDNGQKSRLAVTDVALHSLEQKFYSSTPTTFSEMGPFALIHPTAAFQTKQWAVENFARAAEFIAAKGYRAVAVAEAGESEVLEKLKSQSRASVFTFDDLELPEITALASRASLFVGNDSGIAHIAAAVGTPTVVVFGSSNFDHWRPWTDAPSAIVRHELPCQPCPGYRCSVFGEPKCILSVSVDQVTAAIETVLADAKNGGT